MNVWCCIWYMDFCFNVSCQEKDMALAPITITAQREQDIDFSKPFMDFSLSLIMQKANEPAINNFAFLQPFTGQVWLSTIGVVGERTWFSEAYIVHTCIRLVIGLYGSKGITVMILYSTLLPISAPSLISTLPPIECVFVNKRSYSNKLPYWVSALVRISAPCLICAFPIEFVLVDECPYTNKCSYSVWVIAPLEYIFVEINLGSSFFNCSL